MKNTTAKTAWPPRAFGSGFTWVSPWAPPRALAGLLAVLLGGNRTDPMGWFGG